MASAPIGNDELVELAAVVRAHGLRGELSLKPFNPESELLRELKEVVLKLPDGTTRIHAVRSARGLAEHLILALDGITDRNSAEALRGSLICVPRSALPAPEEGEFYLVDLVGLEARDSEGKAFGRVERIVQYPSIACLLVTGPAGSWEVPDTDRYLAEIDLEARYVVIEHMDELDIMHTKADD